MLVWFWVGLCLTLPYLLLPPPSPTWVSGVSLAIFSVGATGLVEVLFMRCLLCWLLFLCSVRWLEALKLEPLPLV